MLRYLIYIAPAALFMAYASWRVRSAYNKWGRIRNEQGITGVQAAKTLLNQEGLYGMELKGVKGKLTDHYDPRDKSISLSESVATQPSVAALAVTAHEIGHALQHKQGNLLFGLRSGIVPVVNFGSRLGPILFFVGFLLSFTPLVWLGIALFASVFVFTLVTLPLEFDASSKGMRILTASGLLASDAERRGARAVLNAAALTYVASMLAALMQLLYYVSLAAGGGRRR